MDVFTNVTVQAMRYFFNTHLCSTWLVWGYFSGVCVCVCGELMTALPCLMQAPAEPNTRSANSADINYIYRCIIIAQCVRPTNWHQENALYKLVKVKCVSQSPNLGDFHYCPSVSPSLNPSLTPIRMKWNDDRRVSQSFSHYPMKVTRQCPQTVTARMHIRWALFQCRK